MRFAPRRSERPLGRSLFSCCEKGLSEVRAASVQPLCRRIDVLPRFPETLL